MELTGKQVLDEIFNLRDVPAWSMFGVLLAYVIFFRVCQYFLFALQTKKLTISLSAGTLETRASDKEERQSESYERVERNSDDNKMKPMEVVIQDERNARL